MPACHAGWAKYADLREDYRALVYLAASQSPGGTYGQILISTDAPFDAVMPGIRTAINASTARVSFHFHDVQALILDSLRRDRVMAMLCGFFALLGAIVATIGVYGVSAYAVTERHREIGIRLALGASRRGILGLILGETGWLLGLGLAIGAGVTWASARFAATLLFGLQPGDPITLTSGMLLLGAAALVAAIVPARRASRIDPMRALRTE